jgi:hypothetical protein
MLMKHFRRVKPIIYVPANHRPLISEMSVVPWSRGGKGEGK